MPSRPDEKPDQDLAHIIQYAQLAAVALCDARRNAGKQNIILTIAEENELLDYLNGIEERARAAASKITMVTRFYPLLEQLATGHAGQRVAADGVPGRRARAPRPGVSKLLRYYDCVQCSKPHWEDERAEYDAHAGYASKQGFRFGHRTELGLVR